MLTVHSFVVGYIIGVACGILACRQHLVIILFPSVDRVCVRAVCVCLLFFVLHPVWISGTAPGRCWVYSTQ